MRITTGKNSSHNATSHPQQKRVLHVVGSMDCGGIETWLLHILRAADRNELAMDFLVHSPKPALYDEEVLDLGARIIFAGSQSTPLQLARRMNHLFTSLEPYDVLHSHVGFFSGFPLTLARRHNIPTRIAHSHSLLTSSTTHNRIARNMYDRLMTLQIQRNATHGLAASPDAARALFGPDWNKDARFRVLFCGLDFTRYEEPIDTTAIRRQFGYSPENYVLAHVGSFSPEKNHDFILDVMHKLVHQMPQSRLLLVGDGALTEKTRRKVATLGLQDHIHFTGIRTDIPQILRAADAFIFPSLAEGLGLALIEAQAAGLPCFISDKIPAAATIISQLVHPIPLHTGADHWAQTIFVHHRLPPQVSQRTALHAIQNSPFDIRYSLEQLKNVYGLHIN